MQTVLYIGAGIASAAELSSRASTGRNLLIYHQENKKHGRGGEMGRTICCYRQVTVLLPLGQRKEMMLRKFSFSGLLQYCSIFHGGCFNTELSQSPAPFNQSCIEL